MGRDPESEEMRELREQVERLATAVDDCVDKVSLKADPKTLPFFAALYQSRRIRDSIFESPGLFGEPAWDILLGLARAEHQGKVSSITSLCQDAAVPGTTALRWVHHMVEIGLLTRRDDPLDQRRAFISFTAEGRHKMRKYADQIAKLRPLLD